MLGKDIIFILNNEEYTRYKHLIPPIKREWWLCSAGMQDDYATYV